MTGPAPAGGKARNRKMLIYGGVAAALLLMVLLSRRGASQPAADSGSTSPVVTPASGGGDAGVPTSFGQPDNTAQLAQFESALTDQLPQVVASAVAAGVANGLPVPSAGAAGADSGSDPSGGASSSGSGSALADDLAALAGFNLATAQLYRGTGAGGQQKAASGGHGKTKKATAAKKAVHPQATSHHPAKTKAKPKAKAAHPNKPTGRAHRRHG